MSKARIHGNLPEKIQEHPIADQVSPLDFWDRRAHVWCTRILNTRDVDALILVERVGLFCNWAEEQLGFGAIREISGRQREASA
jgi:hypothetical protein